MTEDNSARTVLIAGGGPTGLLLAAELRRAGIDAVVLERRTERVEHSRGMAMHGRTLQVLEERGLAATLREQGLFPWPRTPFGFLWLDLDAVGPEEFTYGFPQWRTEVALEAHAETLGVDIRRGHELLGLTQDATGVTARVRDGAGGEPYELRAAYLVGCDGVDSLVRKAVGISLEDHQPSHYYGVLGDIEIAEGEPVDFDAGLHADGVFGVIPLGPNVLRLMTIEFAEPPDADRASEVTVAELRASVARIVGKEPDVEQAQFLARFGGPSTVAERYREGRVLLAGDAAHSLFVSGTQGLNAGVQDAVNLGWKLAAEIRGWAPEGLLDSYQEERRSAAARAVAHARAQMALMHPLETVTPLRELVEELFRFQDVNRHLLTMTAQTGYPAGDGKNPLTGQHLPHVTLRTAEGERNTAELLGTGRGLLLSLGDGAGPATALDGWEDRVDGVTADATDDLPAAAVLVRPDGQVAFAGDADDEALRAALTTWFGTPR
ncbi:FAD-dependent oxidoreductase [Streptomyces sp. 3MP-14]|uniref:FAD-dependent oxidoreductase n=1 Tax=Streptomyces mimosae TaxID=2586635 RepID=A0A5N6ANE0_9ACTN|nr:MULTISPECIES: FAD-dependent monooxygenase [Streptomyces]KAB8169632.1 FAD-dependent oxidoreductase [Streptomyces mimosae]KAB8178380.1 FAD-dependent oxidoreductase [Streptomyces sp. 3MP-14]